MMRNVGFLLFSLFAASLPASFIQAQQTTVAAPVPTQITGAKKVFIGNAGSQSGYWLLKKNWYSGGVNRAYNQFYAGMKALGQFELVSSPEGADVVFEIAFESNADVHHAPLNIYPEFTLRILDPKTGMALWSIREYVEPANLAKTREKNYDAALNTLVGDVQNLVNPRAVAQN